MVRLELALELAEEIEDLGLDRDVEGGDRFVGEDEFRFGGEGAGDGDALALAAGEFVGVLRMKRRSRPTRSMSSATRSVSSAPVSVGWRRADGFGEGAEDGHARVERGVGILEDHLEIDALRARTSRRGRAVRSRPSRMTVPPVAGMSCMMVRERVDFPQPDSPTRPRISPRSMSRLMPSTALTTLPPWEKRDFLSRGSGFF